MTTYDRWSCPGCGWIYSAPTAADIEARGSKAFAICGKSGCHGQALRPATQDEVANLPELVNIGPAPVDVLLVDSDRFYAASEGGGLADVIDIDKDRVLSGELVDIHVVDGICADDLAFWTENRLMAITPLRPVDVVINVRTGGQFGLSTLTRRHLQHTKWDLSIDPEELDRDDADLVSAVRNLGQAAAGPRASLRVVTIPATWCAGDGPAHTAGWYIESRDGAEEVLQVGPRILANGSVFTPAPKSIYGRQDGLRAEGG